jgi:hypothetical protein
MSLKMLCLLVPVLSLAALTGCKASCTGLCDDAKDAECSKNDNTFFDHAACVAGCTTRDDMDDDDVTDCQDDFDKLESCMNDQSDICKAWEIDTDTGKVKECNSEWEDYNKCFTDYCADHDKRDYCN